MVSFKSLSLLAIAGSSMAAPAMHGNNHLHRRELVIETIIETAYVTVTAGQPIPTPQPQVEAEAVQTKIVYEYKPKPKPGRPQGKPPGGYPTNPKPTTTVIVQEPPKVTPTPEPQPPKETGGYEQPAPKPSSSPAPPPPSGGSSQANYMDTVAEWRSKLGLEPLKQDSKLEGNARKTARDGNGQMKHQLLDGTMGQVLAPGQPTAESFVSVFVGGWLCERPNMNGLGNICQTATKGWDHQSQTGHADILTDPKYKTIGCGCEGGIWSCDLGF